MTEFTKAYQREAALRFPLLPSAHEAAWRYIFDWAIAGEALGCAPGDRVLEFGAGSCYASEWFNRLGYRTVALDTDPEILQMGRERLGLDSRLTPGWAVFVAGDGQRLPFTDASFDGVICLNALHHMPDYTAALLEIRRVIRSGGHAVFSEPGSRHYDNPESKLAREQFGAVEKSIYLDEIQQIARRVGFAAMALKPYVYPSMVSLDFQSLTRYRLNLSTAPYTRSDQIARFMVQLHSVFVLKAPGERVRPSARPGALRAMIAVGALPNAAKPGQTLRVAARARNTGDTVWLAARRETGGYVTFGVKLCRPDGRLIADWLGRTMLPADVAPGGETSIEAEVALPADLPPGEYVLRFDMVDEQVAWFEQQGSATMDRRLSIIG